MSSVVSIGGESRELPEGAVQSTRACPACGAAGLVVFHRQAQIPMNSCLLFDTFAEAAAFPRGDMALGFCSTCGFLSNTAFEASTAEYSARYEETQGFSPRFVEFARNLAGRWVRDFDLEGKTVLEIGCGKGEFLTWMVEAGAGHGIGIDPGVNPDRIATDASDRLTWIVDFYDEGNAARLDADAIVCRHTLEHLPSVREFMGLIRRSIGDRSDVPILFELPDVARVLEEVAFWDVYYEHCSYFSAGSLARLFRSSGFEVTGLELDFDDQYLLIEATPSELPAPGSPFAIEDDMDRLWRGVHHFVDGYAEARSHWVGRLRTVKDQGGRAVIWGAGSKAVSFIANLGVSELIDATVDINPYKTGMYLAGTGHEILAPEQLVDDPPTLVVAMNPIYLDEIGADLRRLGLEAELDAV